MGTWDLVQSRSANTVNEITNITNSVGSAWANPVYDPNGNMTSLPKPAAPQSALTGTFDAWNRAVKFVDATSGNTVQTNAYDGLRRRTIKQAYTSGTLSETRHLYYSSAWQVLEERVGTSTNAQRQFVWGLRYIDNLVLRDRDTTGGGTLNERLYALQDPNWNVVGLSDSSGNTQERYSYDAYGMPTFLTAAFGSRSSSSYAWETLFAGYRYDADTGLYLARNRILDPRTGSWAQRDPAGYPDGMSSYEYGISAPLRRTDPMGRQSDAVTAVTQGRSPEQMMEREGFRATARGWQEKGLRPAYLDWFCDTNPSAPACAIVWNTGCKGVVSSFLGVSIQTPSALSRCYANGQDASP